MSRKPTTLELRGGKGPRQRVWDVLRASKPDATVADISRASKVEHKTALEYLNALVAGGYASRHGPVRRGQPVYFTLISDVGIEAPRLRRDGSPVTMGLAQEQMWRTLRLLRGDTNARELAAHASTAAIPVSAVAAADYLANLCLAGYLDKTADGNTSSRAGRQARYRLKPTRNTGPRPPMVCRIGAIYDPNENAVVWQQDTVTDEDAIYVK